MTSPAAANSSRSRPLRIGLTGGIGSGKSTVARLLASHGAAVVDTDAISRLLTGPGGTAMASLKAAFGAGVMDATGALDRARMRQMAFEDGAVRTRLEAILHPLIAAETERQAALLEHARVVVFDVPLLVESQRWLERVDRVLVVDCAAETQIDRVMRRSGWSRPAVEAVIAAQATQQERLAVADDVIVNDAITESELAEQVAALWAGWVNAGDKPL